MRTKITSISAPNRLTSRIRVLSPKQYFLLLSARIIDNFSMVNETLRLSWMHAKFFDLSVLHNRSEVNFKKAWKFYAELWNSLHMHIY